MKSINFTKQEKDKKITPADHSCYNFKEQFLADYFKHGEFFIFKIITSV